VSLAAQVIILAKRRG